MFGRTVGRCKVQGDGVDAMPDILRGETFSLENMSEMPAATGTHDFGSSTVRIGPVDDGTGHFVIETGPTAAGVELVL